MERPNVAPETIQRHRGKPPETPRRSADKRGIDPRGGPLVSLRLHGSFGLEAGTTDVPLPLGTQRVVAFLALHPGPLTRPFVAGSLWLDVNDERAAANLRSALWRLRPLLAPIVVATRTHLRLDPRLRVDHHDAVEAARRLLDPTHEIRESDLRVDTGELLPDWYDDWVAVERERFRFLRLHALEQLCLRLARLGRIGEAVEAGMAAVTAEPLRESAHRALVQVHLAAGNWWDALRQYEGYKTMLAQQLDLPPSDEMEDLVRPLRRPTRTYQRSGLASQPVR